MNRKSRRQDNALENFFRKKRKKPYTQLVWKVGIVISILLLVGILVLSLAPVKRIGSAEATVISIKNLNSSWGNDLYVVCD